MHNSNGKSIFIADSENAFDQILKNTSALKYEGPNFYLV